MKDFLLFLGFFLAATGWGWFTCYALGRIKSPVAFNNIVDRLYIFGSLGVGLLALFIFTLGVLGILFPLACIILLVVGGLLGVFGIRDIARLQKEHESSISFFDGLIGSGFALIILGYLIFPIITNVLMPPFEWDEIAYHLAIAKIYTTTHSLIPLPSMYLSNWPMNVEMLFTLGLNLGSEQFAHWVTWGMEAWGALGIGLLARRLFGGRWSLLAVIIFLNIPLLARISGTGLIDNSLFFFTIPAFLAYDEYKLAGSRSAIILSGLFTGFAAGSKLVGLAIPALFGLIYWIRVSYIEQKKSLALLILFITSVLGVAGPWYIRSFLITGNPIYPFGYSFFGGRWWDSTGDVFNQQMREIFTTPLPRNIIGLLKSLELVFFDPQAIGHYSAGLGQLLLAIAGIGLVVMIANLKKAANGLREISLFSVGYYILWFLFAADSIRYLFPIIPGLVMLATYAIVFLLRLPGGGLRQNKIYHAVLILCLLLLFGREYPYFSKESRDKLESRFQIVKSEVSRRKYQLQMVDILPAFEYINQNLPGTARILLIPYENRGYYLDRDYLWGHLASQRIIKFETFQEASDLADRLRELGVTHILDSTTWMYDRLPDWDHIRLLQEDLLRSCGKPIQSWEKFRLVELKECNN